MAAVLGRLPKSGLLHPRKGCYFEKVYNFSSVSWSKGLRNVYATVGIIAAGGGVVLLALDHSVKASSDQISPPALPWVHKRNFMALDHASLKRGYQVFKQVCSACHSMQYMAYRRLVNVIFTEEEAKKEAEEMLVKDGPNDEGEYYTRPGKLFDYFPPPYPNEEAARSANNGAYPPDLNLINLARKGGEDYIFHLLTGYMDPPAGVTVREGMYYNPYFPGGAISMAKALYDEVIEYEDGTPATTSQLAKDISTFLVFAAQPEYDVRANYLLKLTIYGILIAPLVWYAKRFTWSTLKTRKVFYTPPSPRMK